MQTRIYDELRSSKIFFFTPKLSEVIHESLIWLNLSYFLEIRFTSNIFHNETNVNLLSWGFTYSFSFDHKYELFR